MARAAAKLMAVVVLPTPPFWLAIAMTIAKDDSNLRKLWSHYKFTLSKNAKLKMGSNIPCVQTSHLKQHKVDFL
jgi:hypothetical protein